MQNKDSCRLRTLAKNQIAHVQRCVDCGCVSVHLGPTTIRLDEDALEALSAVLREATEELRRQHSSFWRPSPAHGIA